MSAASRLRSTQARFDRLSVLMASFMGIMRDFAEQCLLPRLRDLRAAVDTAMSTYYLVERKADDLVDAEVFDAEKKLAAMRLKSAQVGSADRMAGRMSDPRVSVMMILKGIRLAAQVGALFVAQKVFSEQYVRKVYAEGADPPHLRNMLLLFLAIDATVQMLVMLVLILISYVYKNEANPTFVIDDGLIATALVEYFLSTALVVVIGIAIAEVMYRKKYFDFPNQGSAVGKSFRDIMVAVSAVAFAVPFFLLV